MAYTTHYSLSWLLIKENIYLKLMVSGLRSHHCHQREHGRQAGRVLQQSLRAHIFRYNHEAERETRTEQCVSYKTSKPIPNDNLLQQGHRPESSPNSVIPTMAATEKKNSNIKAEGADLIQT